MVFLLFVAQRNTRSVLGVSSIIWQNALLICSPPLRIPFLARLIPVGILSWIARHTRAKTLSGATLHQTKLKSFLILDDGLSLASIIWICDMQENHENIGDAAVLIKI